MRSRLVAVTLLLIASSAISKPAPAKRAEGERCQAPRDLVQWVETAPYATTDEKICANHSPCSWAISEHEGKIFVRTESNTNGDHEPDPLPFSIKGNAEQGLYGRRHVLRVEDGWIVAFNAGEFGAGIWWFSPDGKKRERLSSLHAVDILRWGNRIAIPTGLDHMRRNTGALLLLERRSNGWKLEQVFLGESAYATTLVGHDLLITTRTQLVRVTPNDEATIIHRGKWEYLYPKSMIARTAGEIFIGMRHAVARLVLQGSRYRETWLVPPQCHRLEMATDWRDCRCVSKR